MAWAQGAPAADPGAPPAVPADPSATAPIPDATALPPPDGMMATGPVLPHDLTPWGMFMAADAVVKLVMIALILASVATWTVWLAKTLELRAARRRAAAGVGVLGGARSLAHGLEQLGEEQGPVPALARAAALELRLSADAPAADGIKERAVSRLQQIETAAGRAMTRGTGILATIGAIAPFVGLFGTVWGIMNSFIGISQTQTTNLAVVAPGIAEALLATAFGLVAAIPAVVIYNVFARSIMGYRHQVAEASGEVLRLLSRDLDRRQAAAHLKAAE
ncbi:MAG: tonB-system energizer ExbB [Rhodospirillales bacterium]